MLAGAGAAGKEAMKKKKKRKPVAAKPPRDWAWIFPASLAALLLCPISYFSFYKPYHNPGPPPKLRRLHWIPQAAPVAFIHPSSELMWTGCVWVWAEKERDRRIILFRATEQ